MGIFGAVGRETKGALRSLGYDLRHSKRFRRLGVLAVASVAGGVLATGTLLRGPVPELMGIESDQDESGVTEGWWGIDSETQAQDPEPGDEPPGGPGGNDSPQAEGGQTSAPPGDDQGESGGSKPSSPLTPGLDPVETPGGNTPTEEQSPSDPGPSQTEGPDPDPTTTEPDPSDDPTTDEPSDEPTPSDEPSPSDGADESPSEPQDPTPSD